ncbi:hypothetical protein DL767_003960 [Monosporascus sp. MG133]|nr:hypothetical protein DL767_003960 [Monosporascus sp. MG133]
MDSFAKLKQRAADIMHSIPQNMPSMPSAHMPHSKGGPRTMKGTWQHVDVPSLPRSSHSLNVVEGRAYIFGGEVEPRKPVDNDMHVIALPANSAPADYYAVKAKPSPRSQPAPVTEEDETAAELRDPLTDVPLTSPPPDEPSSAAFERGKESATAQVPCARIGHASAVIGTRIFIFGGRTSTAGSTTINEKGRVWIFETKTNTWTYLDPYRNSPIPPARSYFAAVATDKPREFAKKPLRRAPSWKEWAEGDSAEVGIPQRPIAGSVAARATDEDEDGFGTFIIHGGCLADGGRSNDVWAFDVRSRTWKELPSAPGPARGGAALAIAKSRLYRFGGFDGKTEQGGQLDVLTLGLDEFDDRMSRGEIGIFARGGWESLVAPTPTAPPAQASEGAETGKLIPAGLDQPWPGSRSVAGMELVFGGQGREYLVLMLGERDPSGSGHEAAGKFWDDVWVFQVPPVSKTAASFTDAVWRAAGRKTGEGEWTPVQTGPYDDEEELDARGPGPRGWFASAPLGDLEEGGVVLFGGLGEDNRRLGDAWIFRLG